MLSPVPRDSHGNPVTRGTPEKMSASSLHVASTFRSGSLLDWSHKWKKMMNGYLAMKGVHAAETRIGSALKTMHQPYHEAIRQELLSSHRHNQEQRLILQTSSTKNHIVE
ncbi:hypothetical protein ATANTOWER_006143 [Ataeniobius toweri]|uniref:Uncharacterized protein n=1 Tax=Ataeniobius toweri TaxID=208326 RepID=A0ABU7B7N6_9TELE|nr:hypothetical protein [Ataeniobius toweri]